MRIFSITIISIVANLAAIGQTTEFAVLHTNDLHSKLNGYSPALEYTPLKKDNDKTVGGFSRLSALIQSEKVKCAQTRCFVVDAGDFLMGSLFHPLERETGFQLRLMHDMGYEFVSIGNHEFDYGPEALADIISTASEGHEIPQLLLSNIEFDPNDPADDKLEVLYKQGLIKKYAVAEKKGMRFGFYGIMGYNARDVVPNAAPVEITDPHKTAEEMAAILKNEEKVDYVICLSHSGIDKKDGEWQGEDIHLAEKHGDLTDIIISGHSHTCLEEGLVRNWKPIVQTGSGAQYLGKISVVIEPKEPVSYNIELIPVNDQIAGDPVIQKKIDRQQEEITKGLLAPIDIRYDTPVFETDFSMCCNEEEHPESSRLGPFIADAIYHYVNESGNKTDLALVHSGGIRDKIRKGKDGIQSIPDIFRIVSLGEGNDGNPGSPLTITHFTAKELKRTLEALLIAGGSTPGAYCYYSGLRIYYNKEKGFLNKIRHIEFLNEDSTFTPMDFNDKDKLYKVCTNSYMLNFFSLIRKKTYGLVNPEPKNALGEELEDYSKAIIDMDKDKPGIQEGKGWLAILNYVKTFRDTNGNSIPDVPEHYQSHFNPVIELK